MKEKRIFTSAEKKAFNHWLIDHDLNQTDFANKIHISKQYVSAILSGRFPITPMIEEAFKSGGYDITVIQ